MNDPGRIVHEPDPLSVHANSVRVVGYSPPAAMVITVVVTAWRTTGGHAVNIGKDDPMIEVNPESLREYREEAEATRDKPLSADAIRPARAKVLSVRLNPDEFEALNRHAEQLELPVSALVRGWILTQLRTDTDASPAATVDRIARDIEQLRRQLIA